jgi:putative OPT family oligopeptide transporter
MVTSAMFAEVTIKAVVLGIILSVVLGAANTYLGLKAGLTVAAAIPAAVVSLAVLRLFKRHTILENNMVQTIASAGTAVASGMLFTIPALLILGAWKEVLYWETTTIGIVGGLLGVFFTVPLRRALIVEERLAFPEGVATAEVLKSGEKAGSGVGALLLGGAFGLLYKLLQSGANLWGAKSVYYAKMGSAVTGIGTHLSAALLGVGYIVGVRIGAIIFAGSLFAWMVVMPTMSGTMTPEALAANIPDTAATDDCHDLVLDGTNTGETAGCLYKFQVRYIGVGAMLVGGLYSLYKLRGPLLRAVTRGIGGARGKTPAPAADVPRTEQDISTRTTFSGVALLSIPMFFFYAYVSGWNFGVAAVMTLIMLVTGFLFSAVGAYMAGIVGSSNTPISGVTILTLIVAAFSLKLLGIGPDLGAEVTIFVAAVIAIAGAIASDNLQDLKAGHMLGATPRRQQAMIAVGAVVSALFLAPILNVLITGGETQAATLANAPQANLMASISGGIFGTGADLPYAVVGVGILIALALVVFDQTAGRKNPAFRIPLMAVAVGMYLPVDTTAPIFIGGLIAWGTARLFQKRTGTPIPEGSNKGVLFASGLIAGEALLGILTSGLVGIAAPAPGLPWVSYGCDDLASTEDIKECNAGHYLWLSDATHDWAGLLLLGYIGFLLAYVALRGAARKRDGPPS